jgi:apolipoprotein N-acyltransferase
LPNLSNLKLPTKLLLALVAGLLNWAVFPMVGLWPLVWICQLPLLLALTGEKSGGRSLLLGFIAGVVFFVGNCGWIAAVLFRYGGLSWLGAQLLFLLLALYLSSYYAIFSWTFSKLSLSGGSLCYWMAPALWVSTEYLRAEVLTGFPWCLLGYGLVDAVHLSQIAKWTGVYGLSFLSTWVSAFVAEALVRPSRAAGLRVAGTVSALLCITIGFAKTGEEHTKPAQLVHIVQPNIELDEKLDGARREALLSELAQLSLPLERPKPQSRLVQLVLWPETPAAFYFNHDPDFRRRMESIATSTGSYFFFGFVDFRKSQSGRTERERDPYNSVAMLAPDGRTISQYDKIHLVPFGEYVPYESLFFFVDKISTEAGNFKPGSRVVVTPLDNQRSAGTFVCYEAVVSDLVRRFARDGSQVFVNVTNDAWFGESAAPFQHLAMTRMRAIENHRYVLRAANNGISAIINPNGQVVKTVARNQRLTLEGHFEFETDMTFYAQYGDVFAWLCLLASASVLIGQRVKRSRIFVWIA